MQSFAPRPGSLGPEATATRQRCAPAAARRASKRTGCGMGDDTVFLSAAYNFLAECSQNSESKEALEEFILRHFRYVIINYCIFRKGG